MKKLDCTLADRLRIVSRKKSTGIRFIYSGTRELYISYFDLYQFALRELGYLQQQGLKKDSFLIMQLADNYEFLTTFWSCVIGGIVPIPLALAESSETVSKLKNIYREFAEIKIIVSENNKELANNIANDGVASDAIIQFPNLDELVGVAGIECDTQMDDICFIQYSSGSTNTPKGVVLRHINLDANIRAIVRAVDLCEQDVAFSWMPLTHDMGLIGFHLTPLFCGISQNIMSTAAFIRRPFLWLQKAQEYGATILSSPNFGYRFFLDHCSPEIIKTLDVSKVRLIFNGAEPISYSLCCEFVSALEPAGLKRQVIFPVYGLAEACLAVTFPPLHEHVVCYNIDRNCLNIGSRIQYSSDELQSFQVVDLGYTVDNVELRVMDGSYEMPEEVLGHIQIKGKSISAGYYEKGAEFNSNCFADRWLDTGDIGYLKNGRLVITGRHKDIIFNHGQNLFSHDVEIEATKIPGISLNRVVVTGVHNSQTQTEEVIVFIQYRQDIGADFCNLSKDLCKHLSACIGLRVDYVIPIKRIPKTTSGKIQRYLLRNLYMQGEFNFIIEQLKKEFELRQETKDVSLTDLEENILNICRTCLGLDNLGLYNDFFAYGTDSLTIAKLAYAIEDRYGEKLDYKIIYDYSSPAKLANYLVSCKKQAYKTEQPMHLMNEELDSYNLTQQQNRLYILNNLSKVNTAYNVTIVLQSKIQINYERLTHAVHCLVMKHRILRTFVDESSSNPVMRIATDYDVNVAEITVDSDALVDEAIHEFVVAFNLKKAPLFRVALLHNSNKDYIIFDSHHIIMDNPSLKRLMDELVAAYHGTYFAEADKFDYLDYAVYQDAFKNSNQYLAQKAYWLDQFNGYSAMRLELPYEYQRPAMQTFEGQTYSCSLDEIDALHLRQYAIDNRCTVFSVLYTAYSILLYKYAQVDDFVVGTVLSGRSNKEFFHSIGMNANTVALRNQFYQNISFNDLLKEQQNKIIGAMQNQDFAFEDLLSELEISRDISRNPLFDTMFVHQDAKLGPDGESIFMRYDYNNPISKFDLSLFVLENESRLNLKFEYNTSLFLSSTIERLANHYLQILKTILNSKADILVEDICLITEQEFNQLVYDYNSGHIANEEKQDTVVEMFEKQVESNFNLPAVIDGCKSLSYGELEQRANQLARSLWDMNIGRNDRVVIYMDRSKLLIISILAVLKIGGTFVPLDTNLPQERVKYIIRDSQAKAILCMHNSIDAIPDTSIPKLNLNEDTYSRNNSDTIPCQVNGDDLAYIIYTSGTTGKPKGVMVSHKNLSNYIVWANKNYICGEKIKFPLYTSISFDLTITSIFTPLVSGNTIYVYCGGSSDILIEKILEDNLVDIIKLTPSHLKIMQVRNNRKSKVARLIVGGENLETRLAREVTLSFGRDIAIYNEYGPTEATVGCMIYKYSLKEDNNIFVPIGVPGNNVIIYILDNDKHPVPVGVPGEIYIGGKGVAKGYTNNAENTAEKFIEDPLNVFAWSEGTPMKFYKTGDLAKFLPNGKNIEFLGRIDNQVKIRGYRVELKEIEGTLKLYDEIEDAIVMVRADAVGDDILAGYIAFRKEISLHELKERLLQKLPHYMLPSEFYQIASFPLTINGKIDTVKLQQQSSELIIQNEFRDAESEIQRTLKKVWEEVLGVHNIGIYDNFFDLSGDSIKAVKILARLNSLFLSTTVSDILISQNIANLSKKIQDACVNNKVVSEPLVGNKELSPMDHWFFQYVKPQPQHYHLSILLDLSSEIDLNKLEQAIQVLVERHDGLRLNCSLENSCLYFNGDHLQNKFRFETEDFSHLPDEIKKDKIVDIGYAFKQNTDLEKELLLKGLLIRWDSESFKLLLAAHHLIIDGVSWRIFLKDLSEVYQCLVSGIPMQFGARGASLLDWHSSLRQFRQSKQFQEYEEYWRILLPRYKQFILPHDATKVNELNRQIDTIKMSMSDDAVLLLNNSARKHHVTPLALIMLALGRTLGNLTKKDNIFIDLEHHGRVLDIDISNTIGWFTSIFPVEIKNPFSEFSSCITSIKSALLELQSPKGLAWGLMNEANGFSEKEIKLNYLGSLDDEFYNNYLSLSDLAHGLDTSIQNISEYKIVLDCYSTKNELVFFWNYNVQRYCASVIEGLAFYFKEELLRLLTKTGNKREIYYGEFSILDIESRELEPILSTLNDRIVSNIYYLSPIQEGMLFHYLKEPQHEHYNEYLYINLKGNLDISAATNSWRQIIADNDMLRAVFRWENLERPIQITLEDVIENLSIFDLSDNNDKFTCLNEIKDNDIAIGFDLKELPYRISLCKLSDDESVMMFSYHHIISDGWSTGVLLGEFLDHYERLKNGQACVPIRKTNYIDFVKYLEIRSKKQFWSNYLGGLNGNYDFKLKRVEENVQTSFIHNEEWVIDQEIMNKIINLSKSFRISVATIMHFVWSFLLSRYNARDDIVFGTTVSGRSAKVKDIDQMIGLFINTIPLYVKINGGEKVREAMTYLQKNIQLREPYELDSLTDIITELKFKKVEELFDTIMVIENYPVDHLSHSENRSISVQSYEIKEASNYDLAVNLNFFLKNNYMLRIAYKENLFHQDLIHNIGADFLYVLTQISQSEDDFCVDELQLTTNILNANKKYSIQEHEEFDFTFNGFDISTGTK